MFAQRTSSVPTAIPHNTLLNWPCAVPHAALRSLCIVTGELPYLFKNGGIGTANWQLAHMLGQQGWRVHILYCGSVNKPEDATEVIRRFEGTGCTLAQLSDYEIPRTFQVNNGQQPWFVEHSDRIRFALEKLHREHHFSLVEFADYQGMGFRTIQAKQAGLAFDDVCLLVKLHSSSQWVREANLSWMENVNDVLLDYCERYAFENADAQLAPCRYMLDYARSIGWEVRDDARVVPYAYPDSQPTSPGRLGAPAEIVFFGRLETRKGLEIFVEAIRQLPASLKVSFVGRETTLSNGQPVRQYLETKMAGRRFAIHSQLDRHQALAYLLEGQRLAVMPSLVDNCPNTVIECATHGIPFLAAKVGGIPELIADSELQDEILFEPTAAALLDCLKRQLHLDGAHLKARVEKILHHTDPVAHNQRVLGDYHRLVAEKVAPTLLLKRVCDDAPRPIREINPDIPDCPQRRFYHRQFHHWRCDSAARAFAYLDTGNTPGGVWQRRLHGQRLRHRRHHQQSRGSRIAPASSATWRPSAGTTARLAVPR